MTEISPALLDELKAAAKAAADLAYAPYSRFPVGAALLTEDGKIYAGCNVENAAYPLTSCAERGAVCSMVAQGSRKIRFVVVYTPTGTPSSPCGACRQILHEFGPDAWVYSFCTSDAVLSKSLAELLPDSFGPNNLLGRPS